VAVAAGVVGAGAIAAPSTTGCYGKECEGDFQFHGPGSLIDPDTWQSTPLNSKWLRHSHRRTWLFDTSLLGNRTIDWYIVYVSPGEEPNRIPPPGVDPDNFTIAAGNLAVVKMMRSDGCRVPPRWEIDKNLQSCMYVVNDTCADYYVRVVAHAAPFPRDGGADAADATDVTDAALEAGSDADAAGDAGTSDASLDADARTD
jgi:hypothetical protein